MYRFQIRLMTGKIRKEIHNKLQHFQFLIIPKNKDIKFLSQSNNHLTNMQQNKFL